MIRVSTVYVGANADLVRGFITTPLERVIASRRHRLHGVVECAGARTITVHLKLNYDTNDALTQIQAKVAQVRNDLPPEAEAPTIQLRRRTRSSPRSISGSRPLISIRRRSPTISRALSSRGSVRSVAERADILGDRTFAMRMAQAGQDGRARHLSVGAYDALARNNYLSALGRTKGSMVSVNLIATDLRTADEFRQLVVKEHDGVVVRLGDIADVALGAENYDEDVRFNGETAVFMGVCVADRQHPGRDRGCP